jgi:hypothetical protein
MACFAKCEMQEYDAIALGAVFSQHCSRGNLHVSGVRSHCEDA